MRNKHYQYQSIKSIKSTYKYKVYQVPSVSMFNISIIVNHCHCNYTGMKIYKDICKCRRFFDSI